LLEKYIDIYGPIEENIMIQAHFPQESGKTGISIGANSGVGISISASPCNNNQKKK